MQIQTRTQSFQAQAEVMQLLNNWGQFPSASPALPAPRRAVSCFDPDANEDATNEDTLTKKHKSEASVGKPAPSDLAVRLASRLAAPEGQSPRVAPGPFRCAGELRPGCFVYLYHHPDADAPGGYEEVPSYRLHVRGDQPLSCTCPDKDKTHRKDVRYECKHMRALAKELAPSVPAAWLHGPGPDPFDCEAPIWEMAEGGDGRKGGVN